MGGAGSGTVQARGRSAHNMFTSNCPAKNAPASTLSRRLGCDLEDLSSNRKFGIRLYVFVVSQSQAVAQTPHPDFH